MMPDAWEGDRFRSELKSALVERLAAGGAASLAEAIEACAAAGEAACAGRPVACGAGCPHCCVLNVAVLLPEALMIAQWVQAHIAEPELAFLRKRLGLHRAWYRWMDDEERVAKHVVCPFLGETGDCTIHPVRPITCHGVTSLDSDNCREALAPGVTDEPRLVLTDLMRRDVFDSAFAALAEAFQGKGIDARSIDLGVGVLAFMESEEYRENLLGGRKLPDELWR